MAVPIDYRSLIYGATEDKAATQINHAWWKATEEELPSVLLKLLTEMEDNQSRRLNQQMVSARLYGNLSLIGPNGVTSSKAQAAQPGVRDRISYNVCQSVVDTISAKISKNRPRPQILTSGGDYQKQRKAKKLNQFIDGIFYENDAYLQMTKVFRDAAIGGDGIIHVFAAHGRVKFERVISTELKIDEMDGFDNAPRSMHRVKIVDRGVLADLFPSKREQIMNVNRVGADDPNYNPTVSDTVAVTESWHLKSGPKATDGLHTIVIDNATLLRETYDCEFFPFARIQWSPRLYGPWGQGLVEQIQNIQLEINKLLWVIQRSMHLAGSFKVLLENGSKLVKEHFNNDIGALIMYSGAKPEYIVPPIVQPEVYAHLQTLKGAAYEQAGISQLSASSKKPDGLDSGKALREYNDIETERFVIVGQDYERLALQLGRLAIHTAKQIHEDDGEFEVRTPGSKFLNTIKWADVAMDDDEYVMQMFPTSSLPKDPAGRLATIQEYAQAGYISPRTAKRLLDFPDLDAEESLSNAAEEYLHEVFDNILEDGTYVPPEPEDDLMLGRQLSLNYYAWGKTQGVETEKLMLILKFRDQIDVLLGTADQGSTQAMATGAGPQAAPAAPPVSDLLPNAPTQG